MTEDVEGLVSFIKQVFDAEGEYQQTRPSELNLGGSIIMVSGVEQRNSFPACLYIYVNDVNSTYQRAVSAGAESLEEPKDTPYGDKRAMVRDIWDNVWQIAQVISHR